MSLVVGLEIRFVFEMNRNQNPIGVIKKRNDLVGSHYFESWLRNKKRFFFNSMIR